MRMLHPVALSLSLALPLTFASLLAYPLAGAESAAPAITPIHAVQGAAHRSPLVDQRVAVQGIVTATLASGFYVQDPAADADPATSEALYVFTRDRPAVQVGDEVRVQGQVTEYRVVPRGGEASSDPHLALTELIKPTITVIGQGRALPAAVLLGPGGRVPPLAIAAGEAIDVEQVAAFDPATRALDFWESLEGMLVEIRDAPVVGPGRAEGVVVLVGGQADAAARTARGGLRLVADHGNGCRLVVDGAPSADVGAVLAGPVTGVLQVGRNGFALVPRSAPTVVPGTLERERTALRADARHVLLATMNVENLDPGDPPKRFAEHAAIIVEHLGTPDLVSLEEIQDDNGTVADPVVSAAETARRLVAAITAAGGPTDYTYTDIAPLAGQDGGQPGGNIRIGLLYRSSRLQLVGGPAGASDEAVAVLPGPRLSRNPGRIAPLDPVFAHSRKPLVAHFLCAGRPLFVISNHFSSKGGDQPLMGRFQTPATPSVARRVAQAAAVRGIVDKLQAADPAALVAVLGDLNDFEWSAPVATLTAGGVLTDLHGLNPPEERYSYCFQGNAQAIDHILVSRSLLDGAQLDVVHVNSEFAVQASDHDPLVARLQLPEVTLSPAATVSLGALAWMRSSVEFQGVARGMFRALADQAPRLAAATPPQVAASEQEGDAALAAKPKAVVFDLDETLLDNTRFQAEILASGWSKAGWQGWVERELEPGVPASVKAGAVPGAVEACQALDRAGIRCVYISNRGDETDPARREQQEKATRATLVRLGFPLKEDAGDDVVLLAGEIGGGSDKSERRRQIATRFHILALVGDDLGDFLPKPAIATPAARAAAAQANAARFGVTWFVIPNPDYGSWLNSINAARKDQGGDVERLYRETLDPAR